MSRTLTRATNVPPLTHTQSASTAVWPDLALMSDDDWCVYADSSLQDWEVYVDRSSHRTFLSQGTWDTVAWDPTATTAFTDSYVWAEGVTGMEFICQDVHPYVDAVRAQARAAGTEVSAQKDRLVQLTEKATGLILQAASLNAQTGPGPTVTFHVRAAKLEMELQVLEIELAQARELVDLAKAALVDPKVLDLVAARSPDTTAAFRSSPSRAPVRSC